MPRYAYIDSKVVRVKNIIGTTFFTVSPWLFLSLNNALCFNDILLYAGKWHSV